MTHRFVVIGSNSFSGSHFIRHLLQENYEVVGVSRSEEMHSVFLPYRWGGTELTNYRFYQIDLNHDLQALMQIINDFQPEYVVNLLRKGWWLKVGRLLSIGIKPMWWGKCAFMIN